MKKDNETLQQLLDSYKDVIPYIVFGVLTTIVNIIVYWGLAHLVGCSVMAATVTAWIISVLFAYVTNRMYVFHSEARGWKNIGKEMISFVSCRLLTGLVDWGCMLVFADVLEFWDVGVKIVANVIVVVLNYVASKLVIFRNKTEK